MSDPQPTDTRPTVLITGCTTGGIGHHLALAFHAHSYRVFATARSTSTLTPLADLGIETFDLEVTSPDSVASLCATISALTPKLNILINNAGLATHAPCTDLEIETTVTAIFNTNVLGPMRMLQTFTPHLIRAQGTVINIGSIACVLNLPYSSAYNASKAALRSWSDTTRVELKPFGVKVLCVITGGVQSNIVKDENVKCKEGSLFMPVEKFFVVRATMVNTDVSWEGGRFAEAVVGMVRSGKEEGWAGGMAWPAWLIGELMPKWVRDLAMARRWGLSWFAGELAGARKQGGEEVWRRVAGKKDV